MIIHRTDYGTIIRERHVYGGYRKPYVMYDISDWDGKMLAANIKTRTRAFRVLGELVDTGDCR